MSLYSQAQTDKALYLFPLDTTISDSWGFNALTTTYSTISAPTQTSDSKTGNAAYTFSGSNGITFTKASRTSPPSGGARSSNQVEVVIKTSTAASSGNLRTIARAAGSFAIYINDAGKFYTTMTAASFTRDATSTTTITDGKWHHLVAAWETNVLKIYVDGVLEATSSALNQLPDINDSERTIGYRPDAFEKFVGIIDFYADYASDYTGTTFDIATHAAYVTSNNYTSSAKTASSLFVHPALSLGINISADPATASSASGNHQVSNFNTSTFLDGYLTSLNLENYFKFNGSPITNYGDAGQTTFYFMGPKTFYETNGPSNMPYFNGELSTDITGGGPSSPFWNGSIASDDWVIGIWFKAPTGSAAFTGLIQIIEPDPYDPAIELFLDDAGYLVGRFITAGNVTGEITGSEDLRDNQWHFAALSYSWETEELKLWHDDGLLATESLIGTAPTFNSVLIFSHANIAALIVDNNTVLNETVLDNIYSYGTQIIQGSAYMPQNVRVTISTAYYDLVETHNPVIHTKFDGTGIPQDFGSNTIGWGLNGTSTNIVPLQSAKSIYSYKFINKETRYDASFNYNWATNAEVTSIALVKVNPALMDDGPSETYGSKKVLFNAPVKGLGGFLLGATDTGYFLFFSSEDYSTEIILEGGTLDDQWHLLAGTISGTTVKFYIDGVEVDSGTLPSGTALANGSTYAFVGGGDVFFFYEVAGSTEKYVDHVAVMDNALTAQELFNLWQAVSVDTMNATNATFPLPVGIAGYGPVIHPGVMYVSALLVDPTQQDTVAPTILPMTAFATTQTPNFEATSTVNVAASAATASGLFHEPQFQIGEVNSVGSFEASALFVNPQVFIPGFYNANPMIATNAQVVMPNIITLRGARINAQPLTARALFSLPPAYIQLTDDTYYNKLYTIHAQKRTQPAQSFGGAGLATNPTTEVARSFLKFFSDVNLDITVGSARYLTNEMPRYVYDAVDTFYYDNNGNVLPLDTSKSQLQATAPAGSIEPTPILSKGYFDAWDRKAVNITNIEFDTGTDSSYHSKDKQYSLEFTFKTTKSNQVIAYGKWFSFYYYQRTIGTIGLFDGRLYSMDSYQGIGKADVIPHPANLDALTKAGLQTGYMLSNKRIDDGQWHHVVIQYGWDDNRTQFWIDGELDRQLITPEGATGSNGTSDVRPYVFGFNSNNPNLYSDFQTSVWSWIPQGFLRSGEVFLNYEASNRFTPIAAEPMIGSAVSPQNVTAEGNRGRALMLYWWPVNRELGNSESVTSKDNFQLGDIDVATFDTDLYTIDYVKNPPQQYYGWDVFPVDINGYYVSDLVKPEAYGGAQNIVLQNLIGNVTQSQSADFPKFKVNRKGYFRDEITDARRYIDLVKDIDLSKFDAIFFRNYPDQSSELDSYARDEFSDTYFGLREKALYEDFVKSVRAAVDTGISLYVTNRQLALDLGIVDRVEYVPDMYDLLGGESDTYAPTQVPGGAAGLTTGYWHDTWRNNKLRVVNTIPGLTDDPAVVWRDTAYFANLDELSFGGPDKPFNSYEYLSNGLAVGDTFIYANHTPRGWIGSYEATPFSAVKAGKIITAFANTVFRGTLEIDNPYKDYATSIAVSPGDILNGTPVGGKIFVNFTEKISGTGIDGKDAAEWGSVDLLQDVWINLAYDEGLITQARRDALLNDPDNLDRKLASGSINQSQYNLETRWDDNGMYVLSEAVIIDDPTGSGVQKDGLTDGIRTSFVTKTRKNGTAYTARVTSTGQWFSFKYSYAHPRLQIRVPSMLTRGFLWISDRIVDEGTVNRIQALPASALMVQPIVVADKDRTVYAPSLVASARIVTGIGYTVADVESRPLPMSAYGTFGEFVKRVSANVMTASAQFREASPTAVEIDEVIVYLYHVDPIVYLREEVIK